MQDEDRPLLDGDAPERALQLIAGGHRRSLVGHRRSIDRQHPDVRRPVTRTLNLVVAGVDEDAVYPGLEAVGIPQMWQPAPGEDEGVLQRVLGESRVAEDPVGDGVERIADLVHQDSERLAITPSGPLHEVSVHLDPTTCRDRAGRDHPS